MTGDKPDWVHWKLLSEVRAFEAVFLLLGLEPPRHPPLEEDEPERYTKLLRALTQAMCDRERFSPGALNMADSALHGVRLEEVGAWARDCGLNVATEFPGFAEPKAGNQSAARGALVPTILVESGQTIWRADEVPQLTAGALYPVEPAPDPLVGKAELRRFSSGDLQERATGRRLNARELAQFDRKCRADGLAGLPDELRIWQWGEYLEAFNSDAEARGWWAGLNPPRDVHHVERVARVIAAEEHRKLLKAAIQAGEIQAHMAGTLVPASSGLTALDHLVLKREGLEKFAAKLAIKLMSAEAPFNWGYVTAELASTPGHRAKLLLEYMRSIEAKVGDDVPSSIIVGGRTFQVSSDLLQRLELLRDVDALLLDLTNPKQAADGDIPQAAVPSEHIEAEAGFPFISLRDLVRRVAERHGGDLSRSANEIQQAWRIAAAQGRSFLLYRNGLNGPVPCLASLEGGVVVPDRAAVVEAAGELTALILNNAFLSNPDGGLNATCKALGFDTRDIKQALNLVWPSPGLEPQPSSKPDRVPESSSEPVSAGVVSHSTKTHRRDAIDAAIEEAQRGCRNRTDTAEVWGRLQVLAQGEHPPFLAVTPQGLKYTKDGSTDGYFKRASLDKRLHPEKRQRRR